MKKITVTLALFLTNIPFASAHTQGSVLVGMSAGLQHPLTGLDHLAVLVVIGLLAARNIGARKQALIPFVFFSAMLSGFIVSQAGQFIVVAETMVFISIWVMGALLFFGKSHRYALLPVLIVLFGSAHGHAHGIEVTGSPFWFAAGMLLSSSVLITMILLSCNLGRMNAWKSNEKHVL